jgi:peptide chain release factor 2
VAFAVARWLCAPAEQEVAALELARMLSGETDANSAFVSINSGAGGTDSQDWAEMLLRMYTRYATDKGWEVSINDLQPGQEAGIKGAELHIVGRNAYGYLKAEQGIHRLVRISPYGKGRRETSFAAVKVVPEIDDDIVVEIAAKDVREDTYRASGAGGQHVNRTDSAVRLTHIPTNTVVQCQVERSQHKNRERAWTMLRAKLYALELAAREAAANVAHAGERDVAFGSQIRSYVLHPYKQIKDLRTGVTISNVDRVLDGDLDEFIEAFLLKKGGAVEDDEALD